MFKSEQASTDQGLSEFISKITGPVGGLDEDLFRGLVEPGLSGRASSHFLSPPSLG